LLIILCGKSGCGKDTIKQKLVKLGFIPVVEFTTRPPRVNEEDGKDYNFIDDSAFRNMLHKNKFIEYRSYNTVFGEWLYGTKKFELKKYQNYIAVAGIEGVKSLVSYFGTDNCIVFYIDVTDENRTIRAMQRGSFNEDEWNRRMIADNSDFSLDNLHGIVNSIINNNGELSDSIYDILMKTIRTLEVGE
jgi:guanylate kinase